MSSDTPRTDALFMSHDECAEWVDTTVGYKEMLDFARTLERELNGLRAGVPYPKFCHHPDKCSGLSNCPRDPICAD